jgi:hypothetical protein
MLNILITRPQDDEVLIDFSIESKGQMSQEELATLVASHIATRFKVTNDVYEP